MKKLRDDRGLVQLVVRGVRYVLYPLMNDIDSWSSRISPLKGTCLPPKDSCVESCCVAKIDPTQTSVFFCTATQTFRFVVACLGWKRAVCRAAARLDVCVLR